MIAIDMNSDIDGENTLIQYTDDHYMNKLNEDLEKIRLEQQSRFTQHHESNSPIFMSKNNSDSETDETPLKILTFREVRESIHKYYETENTNELDILALFLKGQKNMYIQSKKIVISKMQFLMLPAVIGSFSITVFSPIFSYNKMSGIIISAINIIVFVLYFFIYYFRFLPSAHFYKQMRNNVKK